jgi:hypothetical protein
MRSFDQEQTRSVKLEGKEAQAIIEQRKRTDAVYESICADLNAAHELAQTRVNELNAQMADVARQALKGTELERVSAENLCFDFGYADRHNIVFAQAVPQHPLEKIFAAIHETFGNASPTSANVGDNIIFERTDQPNFERG